MMALVETNIMFESHQDKKETYFLSVLWSGLTRLYSEVCECERKELEKRTLAAAACRRPYVLSFSSSFGSGPDDTLILNDFVWYASSAACFLQLFDWGIALKRGGYRNEFAAMLKWRDK